MLKTKRQINKKNGTTSLKREKMASMKKFLRKIYLNNSLLHSSTLKTNKKKTYRERSNCPLNFSISLAKCPNSSRI